MGLDEPFDWPGALGALADGKSLSVELAQSVMSEVIGGRASDAQIGAFLMGLRAKGESADEIAGMVTAMIEAATLLEYPEPLLDTCGTGGDRLGTFNVSTCAAFICAGAGVKVAKHGNRAASSECGSADVLEALGVEIDLGPEGVKHCLDSANIAFLFARRFHPAMRHVASARAEMGIPTVMNFLGPLSNPARARYQAIGVARPDKAPVLAKALVKLGTKHALLFWGQDGLDELSISGESLMIEAADGGIRHRKVRPQDVGVTPAPLTEILGGSAATNAEILLSVLDGKPGPPQEVAVLNAAAGLVAAERVPDLREGVLAARESIASGLAKAAAEKLITASRSFGAAERQATD